MLGRDCCIACLGLTVCTPTLITAGVCSTGFITFLDPHIMALAKPIKSLAFTRAAPFIIEDTWVIPLLWVVVLENLPARLKDTSECLVPQPRVYFFVSQPRASTFDETLSPVTTPTAAT